MKKGSILASVLVFTSMLSVPAFADWSCSAKGLASGTYNGGGTAYIHLAAYKSGHDYPVTKKGNVVSGVTQDGTKFVCRKK